MKLALALLLLTLPFAACSAHSPMNAVNAMDVRTYSPPYAATTNRILITEATVPADECELMQTIEVGKVFYGASTAVKETMADQARSIGADAVIEVKTWHQVGGWAWAAPHGSGKAVKFKGLSREQIQQLGGEWF